MTNRLSEKVCIITGTGGGMGREAALIFAREGALTVGCGVYVEDAEATVSAVRAAASWRVMPMIPVLAEPIQDGVRRDATCRPGRVGPSAKY